MPVSPAPSRDLPAPPPATAPLLPAAIVMCGLAGCATNQTLIDRVPESQPRPIAAGYAGSAFDVQGRVADRVQSCWFSGDPRFSKFSFDLDAHSNKDRAVIRIRQGTMAQQLSGSAKIVLRVDFVSSRNSTRLTYYTLPDDPVLAGFLQRDIARWASGDSACSARFAQTIRYADPVNRPPR